MAHVLDAILAEFSSDIERVRSLLSLTRSFRDFGASTPPNPSEGEQPAGSVWTEAHSLHAASASLRTDLPIFAGSLLLYVAGRFEYCIRQIVEAIADDIASTSNTYKELPEQIRKTLKARTLEIAQNPKKFGQDDVYCDILLESLVENTKGVRQPPVIKSELLSVTDSNMRPQILQDLLKNVGLTDFWREAGKQAIMKIALGTTQDSDTSTTAQSQLTAIMEERNQIAHPTASTQFPDADKVLRHAEFLKTLSEITVNLSKIHLVSHAKSRETARTSAPVASPVDKAPA